MTEGHLAPVLEPERDLGFVPRYLDRGQYGLGRNRTKYLGGRYRLQAIEDVVGRSADLDQATDAPLLLVVSILFLALLVYLWFSSHPADFFREDDDPLDEALEGELLDEAEEPEDGAPPADAQSRGRRYRRST